MLCWRHQYLVMRVKPLPSRGMDSRFERKKEVICEKRSVKMGAMEATYTLEKSEILFVGFQKREKLQLVSACD